MNSTSHLIALAAATGPHSNLTRFDFLIIIIGIVVGLSLTRILGFLADIAARRAKVRLSLPHLLYLVTLFIGLVQYWWSLWSATVLVEISFWGYFSLLLLPVLHFGAITVLCPAISGDREFRSDDYFADHRRQFYSFLIAGLILATIQGVLLWEGSGPTNGLRISALVLLIIGFRVRAQRYHLVLSIYLLACLLVYLLFFVDKVHSG